MSLALLTPPLDDEEEEVVDREEEDEEKVEEEKDEEVEGEDGAVREVIPSLGFFADEVSLTSPVGGLRVAEPAGELREVVSWLIICGKDT